MKYPKKLLSDLRWSYDIGVIEDQETFKKEVADYDEDNATVLSDWYEIIIESNEVIVQFLNYRSFGGFDDDADESDEDEEDIEVTIQSNGHLKVGEFLFALNNLVSPYLEDADHYFFEGLTLYQGAGETQPPRYFLDLGS